MSHKTLLSIALFSILTLQLSSIESTYIFKYKELSIGDFSVTEIKKVALRTYRKVFYETSYSASSQTEYDSIIFTGDVMLARNVEFLMEKNGSQYPFAGTNLKELAPNPAIVGNFEASMAPVHTMTPANNLKFSVNPVLAASLKSAGFTHLSLANNHSSDYGKEGYLKSLDVLSSLGIDSFGDEYVVDSTSVTFLRTSSGIVALVGINETNLQLKKEDMLSVLKYAESKSDIQIVYIHWGIEYDKTHHSSQENLAREMIAAGVDMIVGHHPHVVQDVDVIDGVTVFYSLGNYVFDQYFASNTQEGLVLVLDLKDEPTVHLVPVSSHEVKSQPKIMKPKEYATFLEILSKKSDPAQTENIRLGSIPLYAPVATSSKTAIII